MLVAAVGGIVAVIAIGMGARAMFGGGRRDEVIERLERATGGGMDAVVTERERPRRRSRASPASCGPSRGW